MAFNLVHESGPTSSTIYAVLQRLDTDAFFDIADDTFKAFDADGTHDIPLTEQTNNHGVYLVSITDTNFPGTAIEVAVVFRKQSGGSPDFAVDTVVGTATFDWDGTEPVTHLAIKDDSAAILTRLPAALVGGRMDSDATAISGDATSADNLELDYDGTGYAKTNSTIGTTTTNTDMRGTDSAALASVATEARLAELDASNLPSDVDAILVDTGTTLDTKLDDVQGATFDSATDSLEAIRDRGDAAWTTGGGGSITDILNTHFLIPTSIDLADTATVRLAMMLTNALDDLPSTAEITPGTISIERKAIGGTSWSAIVTDGACSEAAGHIYYDEVFDSGTGYVEGDSLRVTFKSQKITVAANDYEITDTAGVMIQTEIRQTMRGTNSAALASVATEARLAELDASNMPSDLSAVLVDTADMQPKLGSPAGASISADIATVDTVVDGILVDTADIQPKIGTPAADLAADIAALNNLASSDVITALEDSGLALVTTTIATLASQVSFTLTAGSADDDAYNGCIVVVEDDSTAAQKAVGLVSDYTGSTKTVTLSADPGIFTMAATDKIRILPAPMSLPGALPDAAGGLPVSGAGGLDLDAMNSNVSSVLTDTEEIGTAGAGLTDLGGMSTGMKGEVNTEADGAIETYGLDHLIAAAVAGTDITDDSIIAFLASKSATADWDSFSNLTDSFEALRDNQGGASANPFILQTTTIATLASQVSFTLTDGSADDDAYNGMLAIVEDVSTGTQKAVGVISDYTGSTKTITLREDPGVFTLAATDNIDIVAISPDILDMSADIAAIQTDSAAILIDTADMQPKIGAPAVDLAADIAAISAGSSSDLLQSTTIATLASQVNFTLTAGSSDDDVYNDSLAIITDSATSTQKAVAEIVDYTGSTKTVTLKSDPGVFTMAAGDTIDIIATPKQVIPASIAAAVWGALREAYKASGSFGEQASLHQKIVNLVSASTGEPIGLRWEWYPTAADLDAGTKRLFYVDMNGLTWSDGAPSAASGITFELT